MNRKIAYVWIFLILLGFISTDFIENFFILFCLWAGILSLGFTTTFKYGWKQSKFLCIYWFTTLGIGATLSALQYYSLLQNKFLLPIHHTSTIIIIIVGINFIVTTFFTKIIYFTPTGILMLIAAYPIDQLQLSYPATTYGILLSIVLIGYVLLTYITPYDYVNLGEKYLEANGLDPEQFDRMHKFKCSNCSYIYEGYEKLDYCPRCMAGSDLLVDVD